MTAELERSLPGGYRGIRVREVPPGCNILVYLKDLEVQEVVFVSDAAALEQALGAITP